MKEQMLRKEKSVYETRECWKSFIASRIEIALERISRNQEYIKLCEQQDDNQENVESLLEKLGVENALTVKRYYEMENMRQSYEIDEAYMQGVRDGLQFISGLDIFRPKDWMND